MTRPRPLVVVVPRVKTAVVESRSRKEVETLLSHRATARVAGLRGEDLQRVSEGRRLPAPADDEEVAIGIFFEPGDPAGIGPELCNALADSPYADDVVIVGDRSQIDGSLKVIHTPFPATVVPGKPDPANARTLLDGLQRAVDGCLSGEFGGLVTAPLAKRVIADAGIPFMGHTEYLADLTNSELPVMMLVAGELRVALASTHIPLSEVPAFITRERLRK